MLKLNKCNTVIIQIPDTRIPVIQLFRHGQVLGYCVILVRSSCNLLKTWPLCQVFWKSDHCVQYSNIFWLNEAIFTYHLNTGQRSSIGCWTSSMFRWSPIWVVADSVQKENTHSWYLCCNLFFNLALILIW